MELGANVAFVPRPRAAAVDFWMDYQGLVY
ncbi:hypothetical protein H4W31_004900 [Plantactinospora soyae]|uniref:Uncharacterized protein n=1 Tax=Plantactinospora soyae TaxID=1544732 RepID=A0A927M769_9ACTN|nr:hypothetical protein [Plantactinospora soyae]